MLISSKTPSCPTGPEIPSRLGPNQERKTVAGIGKRPKLPGGLFWRKESPFIYFKYRTSSAKQKLVNSNLTDPNEALKYKIDYLERLGQAGENYHQLADATLRQAAEKFWVWRPITATPKTIYDEKYIFNPVLKFLGPDTKLRRITIDRIRDYQTWRIAQKARATGNPISAATVNKEVQLLRQILDLAGLWHGVLKEKYKPFKQYKSKRGQSANLDQQKLILAHLLHFPYMKDVAFATAVVEGTGCRQLEVRKLKLEDIHREKGWVMIRRPKNKQERQVIPTALGWWGIEKLLEEGQRKGATLPDHYMMPLLLSRARAGSNAGYVGYDPTRHRGTWRKAWKHHMTKLGCPNFRFHDLRHTYRTMGAEAGVQLEAMMSQVGHMDASQSLDYTHIQLGVQKKATQKIEEYQAEIFEYVQNL